MVDFVWEDVVAVDLYFCVRIECEKREQVAKSSCVDHTFIEKLWQMKVMHTTLFFHGLLFGFNSPIPIPVSVR